MLVAIVDDDEMHGGPVVPEPEIPLTPAVANQVLLMDHVLVEQLENAITLGARIP